MELAGGVDKILSRAIELQKAGDHQLACELCDIVIAAVNGADVAVNLMPLIDKVFDYSGNPVAFKGLGDDKKVMEIAQDLDVKLDKTREWIKSYKKDDNFVSQLLGIMGQDAIYSVPIFNKLRSLGMPKYPFQNLFCSFLWVSS